LCLEFVLYKISAIYPPNEVTPNFPYLFDFLDAVLLKKLSAQVW
jgi:hypothetical protein